MSGLEVTKMSLKSGLELVVRGTIKANVVRFGINVGHSNDNLALHFNPRFNYHGDNRTIVMNSRVNGSWQTEERDSNFPFEAGQEFEVSIVHNSDTFDIYLPNGNMVQFPNRLGDRKYAYFAFGGDAKIQDISVRPSQKVTKR